jgi:hypothetical protein
MALACQNCGAGLVQANEGFRCMSCRTYFLVAVASAAEAKAIRWWHVFPWQSVSR